MGSRYTSWRPPALRRHRRRGWSSSCQSRGSTRFASRWMRRPDPTEQHAGMVVYQQGATRMCRNIRTLFNFEPPATEEEIRAASLQFVRKITGFSKPSRANEAAFNAAVDDIASISYRLLSALESSTEPKNRQDEAPKRRHA